MEAAQGHPIPIPSSAVMPGNDHLTAPPRRSRTPRTDPAGRNPLEDSAQSCLGDPLQLYLGNIGKFSLLTPEQERQFAEVIDQERLKISTLLSCDRAWEGFCLGSGLAGGFEGARLAQPAKGDSRPGPGAEWLESTPEVRQRFMQIIEQRSLGACSQEARDLISQVLASQKKISNAQKQLIEGNLRLVVAIAKKYSRRNVPLEDLIQEGNLGLMKAAEKYDVGRETRFCTYAVWWIRQRILKAIYDHSRTVRLPAQKFAQIRKVRQAASDLRQSLRREPEPAEIGARLGMPAAEVQSLFQAASDTVSLEATGQDDNTSPLAEALVDRRSQAPDQGAVVRDLRKNIEAVLRCLSPREQLCIRRRFGLENGCRAALGGAAQPFSGAPDSIRLIEARAIRRLRYLAARTRLKDFRA
ncbi:MAG: RNA polymerase sigma factor RpoD/SigA [Acidobacteriota bacterium]